MIGIRMSGQANKNKSLGLMSLLITLMVACFFSLGVHAISRGYLTDDKDIKVGMIVRLSKGSTTDNPKVERASSDNPGEILGIATTTANSVVTIASGDSQVYVETTGEVEAYVSDLTGEIKRGDRVMLSPLKGILTKLDSSSNIVVGTALEDFSTKTKESYTVSSKNGTKSVQVAKIKITLDKHVAPTDPGANSSLKRLGRALVGKDISEIRIIVALIIFFLVVVSTGGVLYGAITSAITAFGRNPLAKAIIRRELIKVVILALLVLIVGVSAVYAVLWV